MVSAANQRFDARRMHQGRVTRGVSLPGPHADPPRKSHPIARLHAR